MYNLYTPCPKNSITGKLTSASLKEEDLRFILKCLTLSNSGDDIVDTDVLLVDTKNGTVDSVTHNEQEKSIVLSVVFFSLKFDNLHNILN